MTAALARRTVGDRPPRSYGVSTVEGDEAGYMKPMLCPGDWHELIVAAEAAGRWAARELARRCSQWELARTGRVQVHIEPLASPVAAWLTRQGRGYPSPGRDELTVPILITAADLFPARNAEAKAVSVLVGRAYATAYCTVLAEEASVASDITITTAEPTAADGGPPAGPYS